MARIRSIKPGFFTSEDVSALPLRARLTWIGLWTHCDDRGRAKDNVKLIKAALWPLDAVTLGEIEEDLVTLADHGRIVRYEVDGRRYLAVANWSDHQKISKPTPSKLPAAPATNGWHPPDEEHEPFQESSWNPPGAFQDEVERAPEGKGREGRGEEGNQSARVREAQRFLVGEYRLTDSVAAEVWTIAEGRADGEIEHPIPYLRRMQERGHLADIVEPLQQPAPPPAAQPARRTATGCDTHPDGAIDPVPPDGWGQCLICNTNRRRAQPNRRTA